MLTSPQIFFGQQCPSSSTSSTYSPSLSHSGVGTALQSGSTATTEPFSMHLYKQQPRAEPFQTSPGALGFPSLSVQTGPGKKTRKIDLKYHKRNRKPQIIHDLVFKKMYVTVFFFFLSPYHTGLLSHNKESQHGAGWFHCGTHTPL